MEIIFNDLETARFGVTCARLADDFPDLELVNEIAKVKQVSMLSTRVNVDNFSRIHELEADGYQLMDTIVYYGRSLHGRSSHNPSTTRLIAAGLELRHATVEDEESVSSIAKEAFGNYFGHYHSDPRLSNKEADEAYMEWAQMSVRNASDKSPVLVVEKQNEIVAFITMRLNSETEGEACLSGVSSAYQAKGVYNFLIASTIETFKNMNAMRMVVSTQINNYAVQKVWARQGLSLEKAFYTFHKWID